MALTRNLDPAVGNNTVYGTAALGDAIRNDNGFPFVSILLKTIAVAAVTIAASNDGTNYVTLATTASSGDHAFAGVYPYRFFKVVAGTGSTVANISYNFTRGAR